MGFRFRGNDKGLTVGYKMAGLGVIFFVTSKSILTQPRKWPMKNLLPAFVLAGVTALAPAASTAGEAIVKFADAGDYTDFPYSEAETLQKLIAEHFIKQAKNLPASVELKIEVLDIDLAGEIKANFRTPTDIRVRKGRSDGPEMKVRFTVSENGKVVHSAEETMTDSNYLQRSNRYYNNDELRYEKQMIDDWLQARFGLSL